MTLASLATMFFSYQPDWQLRPIVANARYTFGSISAEYLSKPEECTQISMDIVRDALAKSGNTFSNIKLSQYVRNFICLPPAARFFISRHSLRIETPQCSINFLIKPPTGRIFGEPNLIKTGQYRTINHVELPGGGPRYINMPVPIEVQVKYNALYSIHKDMGKIRTWVAAVTKAGHDWFEGTGSVYMQLKSPLEK